MPVFCHCHPPIAEQNEGEKRGKLIIRQYVAASAGARVGRTRILGSPLHSLNVFQIVLELNERGIKLLQRPRRAEICSQPVQLAAQDCINTAEGVQRQT